MTPTEEEVRLQMRMEADDPEPTINVEGIPVPLSLAAAAVSRCIRALQLLDAMIATQGFATDSDLELLHAALSGEDQDANVATPDGSVR